MRTCLIASLVPASLSLGLGATLTVMNILGWRIPMILDFAVIIWLPNLLLTIPVIGYLKEGLEDM